MSTAEQMTCSVILPTHSTGGCFERSLNSILALQPPPEAVFVVFDGASAEFAGWLPSPRVQALYTGARSGPAAARNLGARIATTDVLIFFDADVLVPPDTIARFRQAFRAHPETSAVIGSYDDRPDDPGFFSQYKNLFHHYTHQQACESAATFWGACGAVRRAAFEQVGGFDERFRAPSIEDIELGDRLTQTGLGIRLCKHIQVKHLKRWTFASMTRVDFFQRALPWSRLILRRGRLPNDLNLKIGARWSVALIYVLLLCLGLALWRPVWGLPAALLCGAALVVLNLPIHRFFTRQRGLGFALAGVPVLWWYYLYSGAAFALAVLQDRMEKI